MAESSMYDTLSTTANNFIHSCRPKASETNQVDKERILSNLAPDCYIDWGHNFFVSTFPPIQGRKTGEEFVEHMSGMATRLQTWAIEITDMIVDVKRKRVHVRGDFLMTVPGHDAVVNDIIFVMQMDESGQKLTQATEFIDSAATQQIGKNMGTANVGLDRGGE